eukprot:3997391-Alexandrium_andersonii.AAC.1
MLVAGWRPQPGRGYRGPAGSAPPGRALGRRRPICGSGRGASLQPTCLAPGDARATRRDFALAARGASPLRGVTRAPHSAAFA